MGQYISKRKIIGTEFDNISPSCKGKDKLKYIFKNNFVHRDAFSQNLPF